jgi:hypothetical protein
MRRLATPALAGLLTVTLCGSASGAGSTSIGQTAPTPAATLYCASSSAAIQTGDAGSPAYVAPAGVITSWSVMASSATSRLKLKTVRLLSGSSYTVTGVSEERTPTANGLSTFPSRISVGAGDRLALFVSGPTPGPCWHSSPESTTADIVAFTAAGQPDHGIGGVYTVGSPQTNTLLDVRATVEPDADGDGFGDVTQDACPTRADKTTECVPPDTTLSAPTKVKTKKKKAKVTVVFVASEPGSSLTCSVDGAPGAPCTSPFTVKLKPGKHYLSVAATDAAGNVDPTPATATVKVKRKKKH